MKEIKETVIFLVNKIDDATSASDALKYTQAALNIAHAGVVLGQILEEDDLKK